MSVGHRLRRIRTILIAAVVVVAGLFVSLLTVRAAVAEVYYVPTEAVAPKVPKGARILVYKLDRVFAPGQIVAYRKPNGAVWLGEVRSVDATAGTLDLTRNGADAPAVPVERVVGRVVLTTR